MKMHYDFSKKNVINWGIHNSSTNLTLSVQMDFEKNYLHHPKGIDSGIVHIILDKNQHSFKSSFADPTTQKLF